MQAMDLAQQEVQETPQKRAFRVFTWTGSSEREIGQLIEEMGVYTNSAGDIWSANARLIRPQDAGMRGTTNKDAQPGMQFCSIQYSDVPQWVQLCSQPKGATAAEIVSAEATAEDLLTRGRTLVRRNAFRIAGRKFKLGDHTVAVGALHKASGFHAPVIEVLSQVNLRDPSSTQLLQQELAAGLVAHVNRTATEIVDASHLAKDGAAPDDGSIHALLTNRSLQYLRIAIDGHHEDERRTA